MINGGKYDYFLLYINIVHITLCYCSGQSWTTPPGPVVLSSKLGAGPCETTGAVKPDRLSPPAPEGRGKVQASHGSRLRLLLSPHKSPCEMLPQWSLCQRLSYCPVGLVPMPHWVTGEAELAAHTVTSFLAE